MSLVQVLRMGSLPRRQRENINVMADPEVYEREHKKLRNCGRVGQPHPTKGGDINSAAPTTTKTPVIVTLETVTEP